MALADHQSLVEARTRDTGSVFTTAERDQAIGLAVQRYSLDRPRRLVVDVTADGSQVLALPAGWQADVSQLVSLEYPIGEVPPALIDWQLYQGPSATTILMDRAVAAGTAVRATFTVAHTLSPAADTIPVKDREAVSAWAAATLLDQLAAAKSGDRESSIASDSVDHGNAGDRYARRARELRQSYYDRLGLDPKRAVAAGVVVAVPSLDSRGRSRIFHPPPGSIP